MAGRVPSRRAQTPTSIFDDQQAKKPNASRNSVLSSLRATQIVAYKPALPAELISVVLDYLPPSALIRCAQVSRKLKEIVYDDTRWIQKLQAIGVWDESQARQRQDEIIRKASLARTNGYHAGQPREQGVNATLFDVDLEAEKPRQRASSHRTRLSLIDGFDDLTIAKPAGLAPESSPQYAAALDVLRESKSARGHARQQYGRIHRALNPFYLDITKPNDSVEPMVFRVFPEHRQQAQLLANLSRFAITDIIPGWPGRIEKLRCLTDLFQNRITNEFRQAYSTRNVVEMQKAVQVLVILDGGAAAVDAFVENHPLILGTQRLANPMDCVEGVAFGQVDLSPSQRFFERLAVVFAEESTLIDQVFPASLDVMSAFLDRVCSKNIKDFVATVLSATRRRGGETYLRSVPGVFQQCLRFGVSLQSTKASKASFPEDSKAVLLGIFESYVDPYLAEELNNFQSRAEEDVALWERTMSEQESKAESFFMSNVNRQAAKRDFLSSFKKVVMMPVNAVAAFPLPGAHTKTQPQLTEKDSRPATPSMSSPYANQSPTPSGEAPTTELAAKAAIMNSRLEGIKSLFSIEVALNLVHLAKTAIERIAIFTRYNDIYLRPASQQCEAIFITLLSILGQKHVKSGFDKAVTHLSAYSPEKVKAMRATSGSASSSGGGIGVEPLVTFLELVNVGDLIQQMLDVFYAQELVAARLTDRDDFLNPAAKEKKRFEQMLDERVAAGMGKGIDVLMEEVEYVCATTQVATDFNPGADGTEAGTGGLMDIGPTATAREVVRLVEGHTGMLIGSTEKTMLDIFFQEVGLRLFGVVCKHIKRQRVSVDGAIKLISDINLYAGFATTLRQKPLVPYYTALRELSQIYLVDCKTDAASIAEAAKAPRKKGPSMRSVRAKELAAIIADNERYKGIFGAEEVLEFAERRADWYAVKGEVEKALYGIGCLVM